MKTLENIVEMPSIKTLLGRKFYPPVGIKGAIFPEGLDDKASFSMVVIREYSRLHAYIIA